MRSYTLHIQDDRSLAPKLVLVECIGDARAGEIALRRLHASPHHRSVEVRHDDEVVFRADAPDRERRASGG